MSEENKRLYLETRKNLVESQSLQRVMAALLQEHSLDEVLNIVCTEAISLTNASGCTISLIEADGWLKPAFSLGEGTFSFDNAPIASPLLEMTLEYISAWFHIGRGTRLPVSRSPS